MANDQNSDNVKTTENTVPVEEDTVQSGIDKSPEPTATSKNVFSTNVSYKTVDGELYYAISLPSNTLEYSANATEKYDINKAVTGSKNGPEWVTTVYGGLRNNIYEDQLKVDDSDEWSNDIDHNGSDLGIAAITPRDRGTGSVSGKEAKAILMAKLGLGAHVSIPLFHSGFRITITPPSESHIIELYRRHSSEIVMYGRETTGMVFSNSSVIAVKNIIDMLVENNLIHSTTLKGWKELNLTDYIKITDLYPLLLGVAAAMYPKGYNYKRACINNPESCTEVVKKLINPYKLLIVNKSRLTKDRKTQIAIRAPEKLSTDAISDYQSTASFNSVSHVCISPKDSDIGLYINIKVPTISEEIDVGLEWISGLEEITEQILEEEDNTKKISALNTHVAATLMRTYSHWVESIEVDGVIISNRNDINENLDMLSSDDDIRNNYIEAITDYINSSMVAIAAIPAYDCPNPECGVAQDSDDGEIPGLENIIPINPLNVFFDLTEQRVRKIRDR